MVPRHNVYDSQRMVSKSERLRELFRRLASAPPASTDDEARELLTRVLMQVENDLTDIPNTPENWRTDGRMYPPQDDSRREVAGWPTVTRYRSLWHNTYIARNGAIEIAAVGGDVLLSKPGADGRHVWDR